MKARIENNTIKIYGSLPQDFESILNFKSASQELIESKGFYDVVRPSYNPNTQILGEIYFDSQSKVFTYPIINKTAQQIEEETINKINSEAEGVANSIDSKLLKKLLSSKLEALAEENMIEYRTFYEPFKIGISVSAGQKIYYSTNDKLYEVIQGHTTQLNWTPDITPALFKEIAPPGVIPNWKQPTGAHDSYQVGNKVKHGGFTWECTVPNNTWEPGVYGWISI